MSTITETIKREDISQAFSYKKKWRERKPIKEPTREEIEAATKEFLNRGGEIKKLKPSQSYNSWVEIYQG